MLRILFLSSLFYAGISHAAPTIPMCLDGDCDIKQRVKLSDDAWLEVEELFVPMSKNAIEERERLASAIMLMESEALRQLDKKSSNASMSEIYDWMSDRDRALNIKSFVEALLDAGLIKFHFVRKIEQRHSWYGTTENTCVIQSVSSGKIYAITETKHFTEAPQLVLLKEWKRDKYLPEELDELFSTSEKFPDGVKAEDNE